MELQPGAILRIGEKELVEFVGVHDSQIVARVNPEEPAEKGAVHRIFSRAQLEKDGVKVGPFGEIFPFSEYARKKRVWESKFPGSEKAIPYPPQQLVDALSKAKEEGIETLVPHFLPQMRLTEDKVYVTIQGKEVEYSYPEGWVKPGDYVFEQIRRTSMPRNLLGLDAGWALIDTTKRPDYIDGTQMYANDPFETLVHALRATGVIQTSSEPGSRFWVSWDELNIHVMPAIAELLGTEINNTSVPTTAEFNVIGNLFHPEFGQATTYEWLFDKVGGGNRLAGGNSNRGNSNNGGLAHVSDWRPDFHGPLIGFRPMVVFPSK